MSQPIGEERDISGEDTAYQTATIEEERDISGEDTAYQTATIGEEGELKKKQIPDDNTAGNVPYSSKTRSASGYQSEETPGSSSVGGQNVTTKPASITPPDERGPSQEDNRFLVEHSANSPAADLAGTSGAGAGETRSNPHPEAPRSHHRLTIQEFFTHSGFGGYQFLHTVCYIFIFVRDGMEVMLAALIKPALACYWQLSTTEGALIPIVPALTYAIGSQVIGSLTDKFGRKVLLQISLGFSTFFDFACAVAPNYYVWLVLRSSAAFFLGGAFGVMLTMWTEICPKSKRFLSLLWFSLFWTTGTVFVVAEAWILDWDNLLEWRLFEVIISCPTALALGYSFFIFETPSYLVISGDITKAVRLIKTVIKMNRMKCESYDILCESASYDRGAYLKLFQMPYIKVTVCFVLLSFGVGYTYGGWSVLVSWLFTNQYCTASRLVYYYTKFCKAITDEAYFLIMIIVLAGYPGYIAAYNISKKTGPLNYVSVSYFFAFYFFLVMNWCILYLIYYIEMFIVRGLLSGGFLLLWMYTPIYYHTQVRAVGVGLGICSQKLGTATAAVVIAYLDMPFKLYGMAVFCLVVVFIAIALSEPNIKKKIFEKEKTYLEVTDFNDLYQHHHITAEDVKKHLDDRKRKKEVKMPFAMFRHPKKYGSVGSSPTVDFNWVDNTPTPRPVAIEMIPTSDPRFAVPSSTSDPSAQEEVPLDDIKNRFVYYDHPKTPTFGSGKLKLKRIQQKSGSNLEFPSSSGGRKPKNKNIKRFNSADNTPDSTAAGRDSVFAVKKSIPPPPVYENRKRSKRVSQER